MGAPVLRRTNKYGGGSMLKDYEIDKPILETDRLIIRVLNESDSDDLKEWLGKDEIYTLISRKKLYTVQ